MDMGKAFGFVFQDEKWVTKVLLGGVMLLIPIAGMLAVAGYILKVARNVAQGSLLPLPEVFDDFGGNIMRGLYYLVISIVYFIPYIVIALVFGCLGSLIGAASGDSESASAIGALFGCILIPIYLLVAFGCLMLAYAGLARYVATDSLSEALKFGEVIAAVRNNPRPWLMLLLVNILSGLVAGLGIIGCGIGVLFTAFIAYCIQGHALGQVVAQQGLSVGAYAPTPPPSYGPPPTY